MKCVRCGFSDVRALVIDHVNGGGRQEREVTFKGAMYKYYKHVQENIATGKYQLLCANCNTIKLFEEKEHMAAKRLQDLDT